jgi:hypothetical protein
VIGFVRDAVGILNLACREHTALFSQELDAPLRRGQRVGLWVHLRVCEGCRRFRRQVRAMRLVARTLAHEFEHGEPMPAAVRARLGRRLAGDGHVAGGAAGTP